MADTEHQQLIEVTRPHFRLPFAFNNGTAEVWEQDTDDEVADCVEAIARTPRGSRADRPDFGITPLEFSERVDVERLRAEIIEWEPRAQMLFERKPDLLDELVQRITIKVEGPYG